MTGDCPIALQGAGYAGHGMLPIYQSAACKVSRLPAPGIGAWLAVSQLFETLAVSARVVVSAVCYIAIFFLVGKH